MAVSLPSKTPGDMLKKLFAGLLPRSIPPDVPRQQISSRLPDIFFQIGQLEAQVKCLAKVQADGLDETRKRFEKACDLIEKQQDAIKFLVKEVKRLTPPENCLMCGKALPPPTSPRKTCSEKCRKALQRQSEKDGGNRACHGA